MSIRSTLSCIPFPELKSVEEVSKKIAERKQVLILFNTQYPAVTDIEHKFNSWRKTYEKEYQLYVYKCVISVLPTPLKTEYNIKKLPTFILFCDGKETHRLEDAGNVNSNVVPLPDDAETINPSGELPIKDSEEQLKRWLENSCIKI